MGQPSRDVSDSMLTETSTPAPNDHDEAEPSRSPAGSLIGRITRLEIAAAAVIAAVLLMLTLIEPDIVDAPFQNGRTLLFTLGGTVLAAAAFVVMLRFRVPPIVRVIVLVVPFVLVNWWLLSPYFVDDVVDESFTTSISEQALAAEDAPTVAAAAPPTLPVDTAAAGPAPASGVAPDDTAPQAVDGDGQVATTAAPDAAPAPAPVTAASEPVATDAAQPVAPPSTVAPTPTPATGPVLLGAGRFVGLAGHAGTGDAGIFQQPDGSLVLRFENFDIDNGPDLEVYLVPGPEQTSLADGSIHLGALKGNVGDQNYDLPPDVQLAPGTYTALVWCEAFSVEFVGATITI